MQRYPFVCIPVCSAELLYGKYAEYYDLIYSSVDYASDIEEISGLLNYGNLSIRAILDLGCGTGSYILGLAAKGYLVDGVDSSPAMVEIARTKLREADVQSSITLGDMVDFPLERIYDTVICLFGSFDYLYEDSNVQKLLARIHSALSEDGLFLLDFLDMGYFRQHQPKPIVLEGQRDDLRSFRATFPRVDVNKECLELDFKCTIYWRREITDYFEEVHSLRMFHKEHILEMLKRNHYLLETVTRKGLYPQ